MERIELTAERDADFIDLETYRGRFVHLLIQQTPNKPVWKFAPDEKIIWQALSCELDSEIVLLAFSSLPKAVQFMQPAVMEGLIYDVNKVGKFNKEVLKLWHLAIVLNPRIEYIRGRVIHLIEIDPNSAETSDE